MKRSGLLISILALAACHSLSNRHDTLAVECGLNGRTQDRIILKFTNPGGVELTPEQRARLQVQYQGGSLGQDLMVSEQACVSLPREQAQVKARIDGDAPLIAEINLDKRAVTDSILIIPLEAPGVLELGLKCPKNGLLASTQLDNVMEIRKAIGKPVGYAIDLSVYDSASAKVLNLYSKNLQDEELSIPTSFALDNVAEGSYKVVLTVNDSYHTKTRAETQSQCQLTVRKSCAQDEYFDPATISCVPKLCDNAYRIGTRWTESLNLKRGEGRYECKLMDNKPHKALLSHTCQAGFFKSSDSCRAARKISGNCALLETDEVVCWGTLLGKDNYPSRKDVNYQTTLAFPEKVQKFGHHCVELESGKVHCWELIWGDDAHYDFIKGPTAPTTWKEVDPDDKCIEPEGSGLDCKFRLVTSENGNAIVPTPKLGYGGRCLVDVEGQVWCLNGAFPPFQNPNTSLAAPPYYRVEGLPHPARQVRSDGHTMCAVLVDGKVMCWGNNEFGSAGTNTSDTVVPRPRYVVESRGHLLENISQLASTRDGNGARTTYALTDEGRVLAWGSNLDGMLANGTPGEDDEGFAIFSRFALPVLVEAPKARKPE